MYVDDITNDVTDDVFVSITEELSFLSKKFKFVPNAKKKKRKKRRSTKNERKKEGRKANSLNTYTLVPVNNMYIQ